MEYSYVIIGYDTIFNEDLRRHLDNYGEFTCASPATDGTEGLFVMLKYNPDVVFIDLTRNADEFFNMMEELYRYTNKPPIVIGISKSRQHAFEAIRSHFFDYWLLPLNELDVRKSLLYLRRKIPGETKPKKLCLRSYKDFQYLNTSDILYLEADNNTTSLVMGNGSVITANKTLKVFEKQLPREFMRVHQSYILNSAHVSRINYGKNFCSLKSNDFKVPFSRSYTENIDELKQWLSKNTIFTYTRTFKPTA